MLDGVLKDILFVGNNPVRDVRVVVRFHRHDPVYIDCDLAQNLVKDLVVRRYVLLVILQVRLEGMIALLNAC